MYAIVEGVDIRHRANIQFRGFVRGMSGEVVSPQRVLFTTPDPMIILDIIAEAGGRVVESGNYVGS